MPLLRVARPDDVDQLSAVFLDCWRISYAQVMPASLVAGMTAQKARSLWADALQRPNQTILAATADEPPHPVVGFVGFQLQEDGAGYVSSLYVSPQLQGGGVGRLLLSGAEQELRDAGAATARLWVFERERAVARLLRPAGMAARRPPGDAPRVGTAAARPDEDLLTDPALPDRPVADPPDVLPGRLAQKQGGGQTRQPSCKNYTHRKRSGK